MDPLTDGWDKEVWEMNLKECRKSNFMFHGYSGHGIWSATNPGKYFRSHFSAIFFGVSKIFSRILFNNKNDLDIFV